MSQPFLAKLLPVRSQDMSRRWPAYMAVWPTCCNDKLDFSRFFSSHVSLPVKNDCRSNFTQIAYHVRSSHRLVGSDLGARLIPILWCSIIHCLCLWSMFSHAAIRSKEMGFQILTTRTPCPWPLCAFRLWETTDRWMTIDRFVIWHCLMSMWID